MNLYDKDMFKNKSILEIGCGTGQFLQYMIENGFEGKYMGCDLLSELERMNKEKFPKYSFITRDLVKNPLDIKFDVVLLCGVFNMTVTFPEDNMKELLLAAWDHCDYCLSFNFISDRVNYRDSGMNYYSPEEVLRFILDNIGNKMEMRHHYHKCDVLCRIFRS